MISPTQYLFFVRVIRVVAVTACFVVCMIVAVEILAPESHVMPIDIGMDPFDIYRDLGLVLSGLFLFVFLFVAFATFPSYRRLGEFRTRLLPKINSRTGGH